MIKYLIKSSAVALSSMVLVFAAGASVASASSISNTGPGSKNSINASWNGGSIHNTGPWSSNKIGSGSYGNNWNSHNGWKPTYSSGHCGLTKKVAWNKKPHQMYPMKWNGWYQDNKGNWLNDDYKYDYSDKKNWKSSYDKDYNGHDKKYDKPSHGSYDKDKHEKYDDKKDSNDNKYGKDKKDNKPHYSQGPGGASTQVEHKVKNTVVVDNSVDQKAKTGNATVKGNTHGGHATTGDAENNSEVDIEVAVHNPSSSNTPKAPVYHGGSSSIHNTGPHSSNYIGSGHGHGGYTYSSKVSNNVSVNNSVSQNASSGNATVAYNTNAGSAVTGNATNDSNASVKVDIAN